MSNSSSTPVAIVTGASRGIGRAIAKGLSRSGFHIIVNYVRSQDAADSVAAECSANGVEAMAVQADVGSPQDRQRLVDETWNRFGRSDVLVNNAGITSPGRKDILELTEASWDQVFDTNLKGAFFLSQLVANKMMDSIRNAVAVGGTIVNISSISAYAVSTNRADYCLAKSSIKMMTELFAVRLADEFVRVYEVCPGIIESDMTAPVRDVYDQKIEDGLSPLKRWGTPEDVAQAVCLLAEGKLPFSTGDRINVDGGFHVRRL